MPEVLQTSDASFEQDVLRADLPVLVHFWSETSGPCQMVNQILTEVAREYDGKLIAAKINVDNNHVTTATHHVGGIPTLILFKSSAAAMLLCQAACGSSWMICWLSRAASSASRARKTRSEMRRRRSLRASFTVFPAASCLA